MAIAAALVLGEALAWWNPIIGIGFFVAAEGGLLLWPTKRRFWLLPFVGGMGIWLFSMAVRPTDLDLYMEHVESGKCSAVAAGEVRWIQEKNGFYQICLSDIKVKIQSHSMKTHQLLLYFSENPKMHIGNQIQVKGRMQSFSEASNPGQFDIRAYYRSQNIDYGFEVSSFTLLDSGRDYLADAIYQLRCRLAKSITSVAEEKDAGVFQAAFLGDQSDMDESLKELYQQNGIAHILAVSGLHISCIGMLCYQLLRRSTGSYFLAGIFSGVLIFAYGFLTGSSISAIRALIMFFFLLLANDLGRIYDMASALSAAVLWILISYPLQLFQCGFQLSAGAVAGIAVVSPALSALYEGEKRWVKGLITSISVQAVTIPVLIYHFFSYPIYSILLNILVIPFVSYLLLAAGAGAICGLFSVPLAVLWIGSGHYVLRYYQWICEQFQKIPGAIQIIGRPALWQLLIYGSSLIGIVLALNQYQEKKKGREQKTNSASGKRTLVLLTYLLTGIFIGLLCLKPIPEKGLQITMLDVGQGDCNFLLFPDGTSMLIDGGSSSVKRIGKNRLEPYLKSMGIKKLDYVLMTHPDGDHINGIQELFQEGTIPIGRLLLPEGEKMREEFKEFLKFSVPVTWLSSKMRWQEGDVMLECLHPEKGLCAEDTNDYSVVVLLSYEDFQMIFTGDLGINMEHTLPDLEKVEVLKVGHHGSKNSTSEEFLEQLRPKHALLSYGKGNSYGHPHKDLIDRLKQDKAHIWKTPECGAITIQVKEALYQIYTYRNRATRN